VQQNFYFSLKMVLWDAFLRNVVCGVKKYGVVWCFVAGKGFGEKGGGAGSNT
jgi:hypothetical protein